MTNMSFSSNVFMLIIIVSNFNKFSNGELCVQTTL
jgi:hypothetical protein